MFTREFVKSTLERMIRSAAAAMLSVLLVGDGVLNALSVNWQEVLGIGGGASVVTLLLCLIGGTVSGNGPAFNSDEVVR